MNLDTFLTENPQALTKLSPETLQTLWQEHRQRLHQALYANEGDRTVLQAFWTWLDQEVGDSPVGRATVIGQFLKIKDCRALGQRIDPNLERWNTPKLDLIDNSYEDYIDYAWQHSTLEALHAQHRDRCAPKPINPYPIKINQQQTHCTPPSPKPNCKAYKFITNTVNDSYNPQNLIQFFTPKSGQN